MSNNNDHMESHVRGSFTDTIMNVVYYCVIYGGGGVMFVCGMAALAMSWMN